MKPTGVGTLLKTCSFGLRYLIGHRVFGRTVPLIRGLVLTNHCNLRCRHCRVHSRDPAFLDFGKVVAAIDAFHAEGGRCLYLEGGEPFLWRDGEKDLDDVVDYAHSLGFLAVVVYTNGTFPLCTSADTVFVSVDGLKETHDALRGKSFDRIMANISDSLHPSLFINYTINRYNKDEIREFCDHIQVMERIRGVFFYFHTPYYGYDELYVGPIEKGGILRQLLELRKYYKILNSHAGLLSALRNDWKRPLRICSVYEKGVVFDCCRFSRDPELCRNCGYLSYAEIDQTLWLKPSALLNAIRYF